jgi:hypothetical protein
MVILPVPLRLVGKAFDKTSIAKDGRRLNEQYLATEANGLKQRSEA